MRAAIFDLDGTLADNMPLHAEAFGIFAARHGLPPLTFADRQRLDGRRNRDIFPDLFGRPLPEEELVAFAAEKEALYRTLSRGRLKPLAGLERLLARLDTEGILVGIATSAPPENVVHTLTELGLGSRFPVIARSDAVARGKPWPDVYLAAARDMGVPASGCLAFEDAPIGVAAAAAAGMVTVAITTSFAPDVFARHKPTPNLVVKDFDEFLDGPASSALAGRPS
jgi:HAD superfamily hydrolase (TIGR01509 family)